MAFETFSANLTAVWHGVVREANPQWNPVEEGNG
jgi:hypothetical protein